MPPTALVIGASRNLGLGLAAELARRGWDVIGTVRGDGRTALHGLADASGSDGSGRVTIARVDITNDDDLRALRDTLPTAGLDLLHINAGATDEDLPVGEVSAEEFTRIMLTNALAPLKAIEALSDAVTPTGTIAVMSSRQGSISMNERGGHEVYRASKSALNQLMRSYAVRAGRERTLLLIHPGWVQTELGGEGAPLTIDQSVPGIVDVLERHAGDGGLQFRDYQDTVIPW